MIAGCGSNNATARTESMVEGNMARDDGEPKPTRYRVVCGTDADELTAKVERLLDKGWSLQGGVCVLCFPRGMGGGGVPHYCQAMTRPAA